MTTGEMMRACSGRRGARAGIWLVLFLLLSAIPGANDTAVRAATPQTGAVVSGSVKNDTSPPLREIPPAPRATERTVRPIKRAPRSTAPLSPAAASAPAAVQTEVVTANTPTAGVNFEGIGQGIGGYTVTGAPPDTNGAAGPNHYVQTVNSDFTIFTRTGIVMSGPLPLNTLWSGFGGGCQTNNDGDPSVLYDRQADRWLIAQFSVTTLPYLMCVAVSRTGDPTGAYYRYSFQYTDFPDYPKFGIWPDGYYVTTDLFTGGTTFNGASVAAMNRTAMLQGLPATQQVFRTTTSYSSLLPASLDGATLPPAGAPNYVVGMGIVNSSGAGSTIVTGKFHVDWTTPANSTFAFPTALAVGSYTEPCGASGVCVPQLGTTQTLDALPDRVMYRLAYRNFGDHESLVVNHSITAGTGVGVRWYELRVNSGTPALYQQGTYAPGVGGDYRWMGSIAMDHAGNMALGYSVSGSTVHPGIHYTGRLAGDALGTMTQGENVLIDGGGSQTTSLNRWGDYSSMAVDPTDDCTFWYTSEYLAADGAYNWHTRIGSFTFAPTACSPAVNVTGVTPPTGSAPASTTVTITGTNMPNFPLVTIGGVAATGVTRTSATQITATAPPHAVGGVSVTVTDSVVSTNTATLENGFTYLPVLQSLRVTAPTGATSGNSGTATSPAIAAGTSLTLEVTGSYSDGTTAPVSGASFTSGAPTRASVNASTGVVLGVMAGSTTITVTAAGVTGQIGVVVLAASGVSVQPESTHTAGSIVPGVTVVPTPALHTAVPPAGGAPTPLSQPARH